MRIECLDKTTNTRAQMIQKQFQLKEHSTSDDFFFLICQQSAEPPLDKGQTKFLPLKIQNFSLFLFIFSFLSFKLPAVLYTVALTPFLLFLFHIINTMLYSFNLFHHPLYSPLVNLLFFFLLSQ